MQLCKSVQNKSTRPLVPYWKDGGGYGKDGGGSDLGCNPQRLQPPCIRQRCGHKPRNKQHREH